MNKSHHRSFFAGAALVLLTFAAYLPALRAGFIWDDDAHVTRNWNLRTEEGLYRIWFEPLSSPQYYPAAHTLFWMEYHIWGLWPAGYHAVNVLLHAANALLLWIILRRLRIPGAWIAALIFAVHPIEVETVAWVMEAKTLLSTLFYLLAFWSLISFRELDIRPGREPRHWRFYALGIFLFVLSLLSKSVSATLPAAVLLVIWWAEGRWRARDVFLMLPLFVLGAASGIYTAVLEKRHVGAEGAEWALGTMDRVLIAGRDLWFYTEKLAWPHPLIFFYPRWIVDSGRWWQYLFPLAAAGVVILLWAFRAKVGRGPLAGVLLFMGTLVPALGFLNFYPMRYSFVADHFQYLAGVGLIVLAAAGATRIVERCGRAHWMPTSVGAAWAIVLIGLTFSRCFAFHDPLTLYQDIVAKNPGSWGGHALLASVYQEKGDYEQAAAHFAEAAHLQPRVLENKEGLGAALLGMGHVEQAKRLLEEVLQQDPTRAQAYNDLAGVYVMLKDPAHAAALYEQAIARDRGLAAAYFNLGNLFAEAGRFPEAQNAFAGALKDRPEWPEAALDLARCLASQGKLRQARPYFELALQLRPGWPEAQSDMAQLDALLRRPSRY